MARNVTVDASIEDDLLTKSILEARKVKETALENAKAVLMEELSPRLEDVISDSLNDLNEGDEEEEVTTEETVEEVAEEDLSEEEDLTEEEEEEEEEEMEEEAEEDEDEMAESFYFDLDEDDEVEISLDVDDDDDEDEDAEEAELDLGDEDEDEEEEELDLEDYDMDDMDEEFDIKAHKENKKLRNEVARLTALTQKMNKANRYLRSELRESNLFNVKLAESFRILEDNKGLTTKHKKRIISAIDKASTIKEVKLVAGSIRESLELANASPRKKNIHESASRPMRGKVANLMTEGEKNRWEQLAGIE